MQVKKNVISERYEVIEMFCIKCGSKIADGSAFCSKCGTKVNASEVVMTSNQGSLSKELDRRALKIYMRNVLILECVVQQLTEKLDALSKKIKNLESNNYYRAYSNGSNRIKFEFFYNGKNVFVMTGEDGKYILYDEWDRYGKKVWKNIEEILPNLSQKSAWYSSTEIERLKKRNSFSDNMRMIKGRNNLKNLFLKNYEEFKEIAPIEYEKNCKTISSLKQQYETDYMRLKKVKGILSQAYRVNIVPGMFRNKLYAIYYLYDIVATSNMSFEMAILNCNLEEIKTKLDTVIAKQQESIINQAKIIAQNARLCEQNEEMLKKLAAVETNTSYAAQYTEIAANNTETMVYLATH